MSKLSTVCFGFLQCWNVLEVLTDAGINNTTIQPAQVQIVTSQHCRDRGETLECLRGTFFYQKKNNPCFTRYIPFRC